MQIDTYNYTYSTWMLESSSRLTSLKYMFSGLWCIEKEERKRERNKKREKERETERERERQTDRERERREKEAARGQI